MNIFSKILLVLTVGVVFSQLSLSQTPQGATDNMPAENGTQSYGTNSGANPSADDKLPFMPHEESRDSAETVSTGGIVIKTFGAMLIIVGLIFFAAWGLKKFGFGPKSSANPDAPE